MQLQAGLTPSCTDSNDNIILDEANYAYECTVIDTYKNGDHTVFIADVNALHLSENCSCEPCLFLGKGRYTTTNTISTAQKTST